MIGGADARAEVLRRIGAALAAAPPGEIAVPRDYAVGSDLGPEAVLERFADRVTDYRASLTRVAADGVAGAVEAALGESRSAVVPADLDQRWVPGDVEVHVDRPTAPLPPVELDAVDAVVTAAAVGIAETGTVVLDGGAGQGRRAITLVPDLHVVVVRADQVVATVPQAVRRLEAAGSVGRPQTWISGPSATSDIELDRVEGVHGPRTLHVILVEAGEDAVA